MVVISKAALSDSMPDSTIAGTIARLTYRFAVECIPTIAVHAAVLSRSRRVFAPRRTTRTSFRSIGNCWPTGLRRSARLRCWAATPTRFCWKAWSGGEKIARYSFIATAPSTGLSGCAAATRRSGSRRLRRTQGVQDHRSAGRPPEAAAAAPLSPRQESARLSPAGWWAMPGMTRSGITKAKSFLRPPKDDRQLPDLLFGLYGELVIFDHVDKTIKVVANADLTASRRTPRRPIATPAGGSMQIVQRLQQPPICRVGEIDPTAPLTLKFKSNFTREAFEEAVRKGRNTSRPATSFSSCRASGCACPARPIRSMSTGRCGSSIPSPFMFYLKSPACTLIGSSPEILCRVADRQSHQPPAGGHAPPRRDAGRRQGAGSGAAGRPQGAGRAHHAGGSASQRRGPGREGRIGAVSDVMTRRAVQPRDAHHDERDRQPGRRSTVRWTRCACRCRSAPSAGCRRSGPCRSSTSWSPPRRGPYGGAVGYLDFAGNMDTCIALRTIVWKNGDLRRAGGRGRGRRLGAGQGV